MGEREMGGKRGEGREKREWNEVEEKNGGMERGKLESR